jgi:hypothetical protein
LTFFKQVDVFYQVGNYNKVRFFDAIGQGRFMLISQVNPANGLFERELFGA